MKCRRLLGVLILIAQLTTQASSAAPGPSQSESTAASDRDNAISQAIQEADRRQKALEALTPEQKRQLAEQEAQRNRIPLATDDYDWRRIARGRGVPEETVQRLSQQKFIVGRVQLKQSFEIYTAPTVPVFITSDALLNGFHALFEDSFRELEIHRAPELRAYLEQIVTRTRALLQHPPYPIANLEPGWQQAQRVVGPALVLLGTPMDFFDADVRGDITTEVRRIRIGDSVELPHWLAPSDPTFAAIDYRRMRPIGFYAGLTNLADYFRAVRWLQSVPFRPDRDIEMTALALLGAGMKKDVVSEDDFLSRYARFLGKPADHSLLDARWFLPFGERRPLSWTENLATQRAQIARVHPSVNDTVRSTNAPATLPFFYVLPAFGLLDAGMFQKLVDDGQPATGLYLAQVLGSTLQADQQAQAPSFVATTIKDTTDRLFLDTSWGSSRPRIFDDRSPVYEDYLAVLHTLFATADSDAPAFMSSSAWMAKSTQTCLASWTQMRHTFALQAKQVIAVMSMHNQPPGFIEPNPAFFRRFAEFLGHVRAKLEADGLFTENGTSMGAFLRTRADGLDRLVVKIKASADATTTTEYAEVTGWLNHYGAFKGLPDTSDSGGMIISAYRAASDTPARTEPLEVLSAYLKQTAARYERGELVARPEKPNYESLLYRWRTLEHTTLRLETLVQKQLRGRPWTEEEAKFIEGFGTTLAATMGYFGNAYSPRDDAARCAEFVRYANRATSLNAAVGRPRIFYVLYPWEGREIYCEGAVLPYYEFESHERLSDEDWRKQLDSADIPAQPAWTAAITAGPPNPMPRF